MNKNLFDIFKIGETFFEGDKEKTKKNKRKKHKKKKVTKSEESIKFNIDLLDLMTSDNDSDTKDDTENNTINDSEEVTINLLDELTTVIESTTSKVKSKVKSIISSTFDFLITRENLSEKKSERYKDNIAAIKTLNKINSDNRLATFKEQSILGKYVGWGGLSEKFKENESSNAELKSLLGDCYDSAKSSTLTSFYTPASVIKFMYKVLDRLGFEKGRILEPSCGTGRFLGFMSEEMYFNSKIVGIEMDKLSSAICKNLYQSAQIINSKFEDTDLKDNSFDICISNIPFGEIKPYDKSDKDLNELNLYIHDYYFIKSLKKIRDKGIIAFITSSGTMDKENRSLRRKLDSLCDFLGAVRLPKGTFCDTDVTVDIIFLQKNENKTYDDSNVKWVNIVDFNGFQINEYFANNPGAMLGEMKFVSSQYGDKQILENTAKVDTNSLNKLLKFFPIDVYQTPLTDEYMYDVEELKPCNDALLKEGEFIIEDNNIYQKQGSYLIPSSYVGIRKDKLSKFIRIKNLIKELINEQLNGCSDTVLKELQDDLTNSYDEYVEIYGYINSKANKKILVEDTLYYLVASLEKFNRDTEEFEKADIFTTRTIGANKEFIPQTLSDGILLSFATFGELDIKFIADKLNRTYEDVKKELLEDNSIFLNPATMKYEYRDQYLSGYVKEKLKIAKEFEKVEPEKFTANVQALELNQPEYETDIYYTIASPWVPSSVKEDFINSTLTLYGDMKIKLLYTVKDGYTIDYKGYIPYSKNTVEWGTDRKSALSLLDCILNNKDIVVTDKVDNGHGGEKTVKNIEATQLALSISEKWKAAFIQYVDSNPSILKSLTDLYNDKFIIFKEREYSNIFKNLNINPNINLREHQLKAASRIIVSQNNTLLAHSVGSGKTYTMITANQELARIGANRIKRGYSNRLSHKGLFVIPNNLCESGQFAREYLTLYPQANILATTSKDFTRSNRRRIISKMVTCNWDAIIIPHSVLGLIPMKPETEKAMLLEDLAELNNNIDYYKKNGKSISIKEEEKMKEDLENRIKELNDMHKDEGLLYWEDLGITNIFLDEAHRMKNLYLGKINLRVAGISNVSAKKTQDLFNKIRYQKTLFGDKGIVFATATPISNTMAEFYTLCRYLNFDNLSNKYHIGSFDAWANTFGEVVSSMEVDPTGTGFRMNKRFSKFCNLPELLNIFREFADIVNIQDIDDINLPKHVTGKPIIEQIEPTYEQKDYIEELIARVDAIKNKSVRPDEDNMLNVVNDGRCVALSPILRHVPGKSPKIEKAGENIAHLYKEYPETTHLVFCDLGTPNGGINAYDELKEQLLLNGVKSEDIAYIHDAKTPDSRKKLIDDFNDGRVKILIGSTEKMGEGTNFQKLIKSIHHLDCPWKPSGLEQRNGRIIRQGNTNSEIYEYRYVVKGSFDAYSWQTIEVKAKFIQQVISGTSSQRVADDINESTMSYEMAKACACDNPLLLDLATINSEIQKLSIMKKAFKNQLLFAINTKHDRELSLQVVDKNIEKLNIDLKTLEDNYTDSFNITLNGVLYTDMELAIKSLADLMESRNVLEWGSIYGLNIIYAKDNFEHAISIGNEFPLNYKVNSYPKVMLQNILSIKSSIINKMEYLKGKKSQYEMDLEGFKSLSDAGFKHEDELKKLILKKKEIETKLNLDGIK